MTNPNGYIYNRTRTGGSGNIVKRGQKVAKGCGERMNSKDIITWVELQKVDFSNEQSIIKFVSELEGKRF